MNDYATRLCILAFTLLGTVALAEDRGKVDGAIWHYEMSRVANKDDTRTGRFRIEGTDIFQPRDKKPTKIGNIVRDSNAKPKKGDQVRVEFDQLHGSDQKKLKCSGRITFESFGEVEGRLIDSDGRHWNFKASRVQE